MTSALQGHAQPSLGCLCQVADQGKPPRAAAAASGSSACAGKGAPVTAGLEVRPPSQAQPLQEFCPGTAAPAAAAQALYGR